MFLRVIGLALVTFAGFSFYKMYSSPAYANASTVVPVGALVTFNDGTTAQVTQATDIPTLQANGATSYAYNGVTYLVPTPAIPANTTQPLFT